ncbi:MAG: CDP-alcohol phosphatidyltransferase family protein [Pyrinomonadaceae bacterium]|nr:CDP-alcohol phosphatidyltransferase family protein [Pyrinomonadaceae bacterium]
MINRAVLFVDAENTLDGAPLTLVEISGVPLIKRVILDLKRAGVEGVTVALDKPSAPIEIFLNRERLGIKVLRLTTNDLQAELIKEQNRGVLLLGGDRLYDFRALSALVNENLKGDKALVAVDLKTPDDQPEAERHYTMNDGKVIEKYSAQEALMRDLTGREVGADVYRGEALITALGLSSQERREYGRALVKAGEAAYFDIGNGFVQTIASRADVRQAEQRILRYVWKETDGIHARWNKKIALPFIKLLLKTPITPNMISVMGVFVSLAAGYFFSIGDYFSNITGALLSYVSSLFDHMDGSVARLKSMESAFGSYFETVCDFVYYFSFAVGISIGLYRATDNQFYLFLGVALLFGTLVSLFTISYQRKEFAKDPSKLAGQAHNVFDNAHNPVYRFGRKTYFVMRRPVLPYYLFILTVLNLLPIVLFIAALGANLFWAIQLYSNRLFRHDAASSAET